MKLTAILFIACAPLYLFESTANAQTEYFPPSLSLGNGLKMRIGVYDGKPFVEVINTGGSPAQLYMPGIHLWVNSQNVPPPPRESFPSGPPLRYSRFARRGNSSNFVLLTHGDAYKRVFDVTQDTSAKWSFEAYYVPKGGDKKEPQRLRSPNL